MGLDMNLFATNKKSKAKYDELHKKSLIREEMIDKIWKETWEKKLEVLPKNKWGEYDFDNFTDENKKLVDEYRAEIKKIDISKINPYDVIRKLDDCNKEYNIEKNRNYTTEFRILMGLCEVIRSVGEKPKFKYLDIVKHLNSNAFYYVMDFNGGMYYVDDCNGESADFSQSYFEANFKKIGEVTKDVLDAVRQDETKKRRLINEIFNKDTIDKLFKK